MIFFSHDEKDLTMCTPCEERASRERLKYKRRNEGQSKTQKKARGSGLHILTEIVGERGWWWTEEAWEGAILGQHDVESKDN